MVDSRWSLVNIVHGRQSTAVMQFQNSNVYNSSFVIYSSLRNDQWSLVSN